MLKILTCCIVLAGGADIALNGATATHWTVGKARYAVVAADHFGASMMAAER